MTWVCTLALSKSMNWGDQLPIKYKDLSREGVFYSRAGLQGPLVPQRQPRSDREDKGAVRIGPHTRTLTMTNIN